VRQRVAAAFHFLGKVAWQLSTLSLPGAVNGRIGTMKPSIIIAAVFACACVSAQETPYEAYAAQIEALQRDGADLAREYGRDVLIDRYRALIDAHPGFPNNIQLDTQIAMLYESDFVDRGEPPNLQAAYETYQRIIETYDPEHPYMMTVRHHAADRASELDPGAARGMYESIIVDYPGEDAMVVQSRYALGKLAEQQGDPIAAQQHFDQVLNYVPSGAPLSESQQASIAAYEANAVASTLANVLEGHDTPQARMKALKKYMEKHQELMLLHGDLVQRFARSIEKTGGFDSELADTAIPTDFSLSSLKKNRQADPDRKSRSRVRELRARDTAERQAELARADAMLVGSLPAGTHGQKPSSAVASGSAATSIPGSRGFALAGVAAAAGAVAAIAITVIRRRRA